VEVHVWVAREPRRDLGGRVRGQVVVDREHHRPARRLEVQAHHVDHLRGELRVLAEFERALPVGFQPVSRHNFAT
jgi:hypothetical protein